jgi:hypothetical protein
MQSRVDDFLYQLGIPSDWHFSGMILLGKLVQSRTLGSLRIAPSGTSIGGIL